MLSITSCQLVSFVLSSSRVPTGIYHASVGDVHVDRNGQVVSIVVRFAHLSVMQSMVQSCWDEYCGQRRVVSVRNDSGKVCFMSVNCADVGEQFLYRCLARSLSIMYDAMQRNGMLR